MNERIKELRKTLGLTQQEFADRIKVKRNTVATYEMGRTTPSDSAVSLICREFNVNDSWLRDGIGDMFRKQNRDEELADFFNDVLQDKPDDFRRRFIQILSRLDVKEWELLEQMARRLADETEKADPED